MRRSLAIAAIFFLFPLGIVLRAIWDRPREPDVAAIAGKAVADLAAREVEQQRLSPPIDFDITVKQSGDGIDEPRMRFYRRPVDRAPASNGQ